MSLSQFCRGSSKTSNVMANYFGVEVSRTLLNSVISKFKKTIKDGARSMLFGEQEYIFVFDNSQIVTIMKYASGKNASRVLKGTASCLR